MFKYALSLFSFEKVNIIFTTKTIKRIIHKNESKYKFSPKNSGVQSALTNNWVKYAFLDFSSFDARYALTPIRIKSMLQTIGNKELFGYNGGLTSASKSFV